MKFTTTEKINKDMTYIAKEGGLFINNELVVSLDLSSFFKVHHQSFYPVKVIDENTIDIITFIEIRGKSDFSMLDSMAKVKDIVQKSDVGAGIQDHAVGYGLFDFNEQMLQAHKKPLNGVELYMKEDDEEDDIYDHLVLIAKNRQGYNIISKLISIAASRITVQNKDSKIVRPYNFFKDFKDFDMTNIIVLHGYRYSYINKALSNSYFEKAEKYVQRLKDIFGSSNVYLEIQSHESIDDDINELIYDLSEKTTTKVVLTNDFHMMNREDLDTLEVLQALGLKQQVGYSNWHLEGDNWYYHTNEDIEKLNIGEIADNTIEIFNKVDSYSLDVKENFMPEFKIPDGFDNEVDYFEYLSKKGLSVRMNGQASEKYQERLNYELDIIEKMGFPGYFLIVADFVNYAKRNYDSYDEKTGERWKTFLKKSGFDPAPIAIGPARGSAAGSLVSYAMGITDIDPLKYDLIFERFLNPERVSMPDIDVDIPDNKRAEVIEYVQDYYNNGETSPLKSKVAGIAVFGTMKVKAVLKAVVRGLYADPTFGEKLAGLVPDDLKATIADTEKVEEFKLLLEKDKRVAIVLKHAKKLEFIVNNLSQHASGYVIAPQEVINFLPTTFAYSNKTGEMEMLTSYTHIESNGLLKMDFLGLKAMTVINDTINDINKHSDRKEPLTMQELLSKAPTDLNVYKHLKLGRTGDVFQLQSTGMTDVIMRSLNDVDDSETSIEKAKSENFFNRIVAGIAMYRPGPMAYIDEFVRNALHPEQIRYVVEDMKDILAGSFGLLIYQESIMALLQQVAGFSLGGADLARRTIGKKRIDDLPALKKMFIYGDEEKNMPGGLKMGHSMDELEKLWGDIETFAAYGFNKSHAAGYAHITIIMAYLAYYYAPYYAAANLNHPKDTDDIMRFINIYKGRGLKIASASVNASSDIFAVEGKSVRFGLGGIRMVAKKAPSIYEEREQHGKFKNYYDFISRMARNQQDKPLNKGSIEGLIYSGALDIFPGSRASKIKEIEKVTSLYSLLKKEDHVIFDDTTSDYFDKYLSLTTEEMPLLEMYEKEHHYTGFYITGHPADLYNDQKDDLIDYMSIKELEPLSFSNQLIAVITEVRQIMTKKNTIMAFIKIEDSSGSIEAVVFPDTFERFGRFVKENEVVVINGDVQKGKQVVVNSIVAADQRIVTRDIDSFQINLSSNQKEALDQLSLILKKSNDNQMDDVINLSYVFNNKVFTSTKSIKKLRISNDVETTNYIKHLLGSNNFNVIWKTKKK